MKKAAAFAATKLAVHGGYASAWKKDLSAGITEHSKSKTIISIQPPGTTTLGMAFVRAFHATGDTQFLDAAKEAGKALAECQLASGGWDSDFDFDPEKAKQYYLHQQVLAGDKEARQAPGTPARSMTTRRSPLCSSSELAHLPECKGDTDLQEGRSSVSSFAPRSERWLAAAVRRSG